MSKQITGGEFNRMMGRVDPTPEVIRAATREFMARVIERYLRRKRHLLNPDITSGDWDCPPYHPNFPCIPLDFEPPDNEEDK